jgi:hypothetical protein
MARCGYRDEALMAGVADAAAARGLELVMREVAVLLQAFSTLACPPVGAHACACLRFAAVVAALSSIL